MRRFLMTSVVAVLVTCSANLALANVSPGQGRTRTFWRGRKPTAAVLALAASLSACDLAPKGTPSLDNPDGNLSTRVTADFRATDAQNGPISKIKAFFGTANTHTVDGLDQVKTSLAYAFAHRSGDIEVTNTSSKGGLRLTWGANSKGQMVKIAQVDGLLTTAGDAATLGSPIVTTIATLNPANVLNAIKAFSNEEVTVSINAHSLIGDGSSAVPATTTLFVPVAPGSSIARELGITPAYLAQNHVSKVVVPLTGTPLVQTLSLDDMPYAQNLVDAIPTGATIIANAEDPSQVQIRSGGKIVSGSVNDPAVVASLKLAFTQAVGSAASWNTFLANLKALQAGSSTTSSSAKKNS